MLNGTETIRPLRDRVLVRELPWRNQTATGLHLPDQAQKKDEVWRAVVVAVGPGKPPEKLMRRARSQLGRYKRNGEELTKGYSEEPEDVARDIDDGLASGFGADVKPGEVVLVSKYVHSKIGFGTETLCCIATDDILGVVDGEANDLRRALETAIARLDAVGFGEVA